jgi:hypothetical protein
MRADGSKFASEPQHQVIKVYAVFIRHLEFAPVFESGALTLTLRHDGIPNALCMLSFISTAFAELVAQPVPCVSAHHDRASLSCCRPLI